ncbi:ATP-binding protein [Aliiroseovarius sp. F47248L]|uniref:ATP-binding protein n=1 Tax=Aliiroseovarius sp. F47248L TaxID=2926420 RepID=UPI001FF40210|nr:ATP-binding protein [Aliiroseovarius sp. F47248L]MCK0139172.1 ATP-binding protein [Aliiroseovarius sp. F47248L]
MPMLILGKHIQQLIRNNSDVKFYCRTTSSDFRGYADHIGFFRYCGFDRGSKLGQAIGSNTYIPIQSISIDKIKIASGDRPYGEIVEEKASELTHILTQERSGDLFVALSYSLREIMRNAVEHSEGSNVVLFGQYWPKNGNAEIVLLDDGVGITKTLGDCVGYEGKSDQELLECSLEPGVTGTTEAERAHQDPSYRNSGFGLYVTSEFCAEHGLFQLISGSRGITRKKKALVHHDWLFEGTCVQLSLDTRNLKNAGEQIEEIIARGEKLVPEHIATKTASKASRIKSSWLESG